MSDPTSQQSFAMRLALVAVVASALTGCSLGKADLEQRIEDIKARKGAPIEPLPIMKTFETFEYTAQQMRDPFSPSIEEEETGDQAGPRPDMNRPKDPLESYPLDSLDMVGTLGLGGDVTALVKDPDGVIHQVRPDNYIGQSFGRITGVFEDRIELVELIPNGVGGWIERPASISLESE
jgi:type IV pilus assembly protein PilP